MKLLSIAYCRSLHGSGRIVYCDRYYTSLPLFIQLLSQKIYAIGTISTRCSGFPHAVKINKNEKLPRGTCRSAVTELGQLGHITAMAWVDSKPVHMISTAVGHKPARCERRVRGCREKETFRTFLPYEMYQKKMGGVDLHDFLRQARYSIQFAVKKRKWYRMVFTAILDLVATNATILWKFIYGTDKSMRLSHGDFMERLSVELLNYTTSVFGEYQQKALRNKRLSSDTIPIELATSLPSLHNVAKIPWGEGYSGPNKNAKRCFVCAFTAREKKEKSNVTTTTMCIECNVPCCTTVRPGHRMCYDILHGSEVMLEYISEKSRKQAAKENQKSDNQKRLEERVQRMKVLKRQAKAPACNRV